MTSSLTTSACSVNEHNAPARRRDQQFFAQLLAHVVDEGGARSQVGDVPRHLRQELLVERGDGLGAPERAGARQIQIADA
jgi:hypothetical protein